MLFELSCKQFPKNLKVSGAVLFKKVTKNFFNG